MVCNGEIPLLITDGWSWSMGHKTVPYQVIREHVKELQPQCLLADHTHLRCLFDVDVAFYESGSPCPDDNTIPSTLSALINSGGNGWFWSSSVPTASLMSVDSIVDNLHFVEPRWCSYILNCPPNNEGRLDSNIVNRLNEVGQSWSPDTSRPALPPQEPQMEHPITPVSAAATSGNADYAIDGKNDRGYYTVWETSTSLPQSITVDLGMIHPDVNMLYYVPKYIPSVNPQEEGSIQSYRIYKGTDGNSFTKIASGNWNGDTKMKVITFTPTSARYIRLEAVSARNNFAAATEISIGAATRAARPGDPASTAGPTSAPTSTTAATSPSSDNIGDVNNNGTIDIVDALLVAQFYVGLNPSNFDKNRADANCNGTIDIVDALLIAQYYVGLVSTFC
jgi:alpha-L-fucosidase